MKKQQIKKDNWKEKAEEYLAGWKRAQADFINYKKDEARRIEAVVKFSNENLVMELIDVLDNLDRVLAETPESVQKEEDWFKGLKQTRKQFEDFFDETRG